ncbi:MAG: beta-lactamase class A [Alphaproteobacteria bacterium]|jgi:beta-lactamase class A
MMAAVAIDPRICAAQALLGQFCAGDPGRSVALTFCAHKGPRYKRVTIDAAGTVLRPVASVIKVALVMALYDLAHTGLIDLDEQMPLEALGATRYCSIMAAFDKQRRLSLRELAAISLITSDNPVAVLLEERVGQQAVGAVLARAGIARDRQMRVGFREEELGPENRANQMSALDVIEMFELLRSERRYGEIVLALENNLRNARIPALLPDEVVIAHKTGSLNGVVNDAGIVRLGVESFVVAFLADDQADPVATTNDIAECAKELYELILAG